MMRIFLVLFFGFGCGAVWAQYRMISHLTRQGGGFVTEIFFENPVPTEGSYGLEVFDAGGQSLGSVSGTISAEQTEAFSPTDLFGASVDASHFLISPDTGEVRVSVAYRKASGTASPAHVRESAVQARRWRIFPGDWSVAWDGFAVVNTGDSETPIWVSQIGFDGTIVKSVCVLDGLASAAKGLYVLHTDFSNTAQTYFEIAAQTGLAITALRGTLDQVYLWENAALPLEAREDPPPEFDKWSLWSGQTQLRGANLWQTFTTEEAFGDDLGTDPVGPPITQDELDLLRSLGCNYVNISHPGLFTIDPPYGVDTDAQTNLDGLLNKVAQADMYAVISFRTGPGRSEFDIHFGDSFELNPDGGWFPASLNRNLLWTDSSVQAAWVDMWRYAANRYRDNRIVVGYELIVEANPEEVFHGLWLDPESYYPAVNGTLEDWNIIYPPIVAGIREVDANTPILVPPVGYSGITWLPYVTPSTEDRVVHSIHQYEPFELTHQGEYPPPNGYPGTFQVCCDDQLQTVDRTWLNTLLTKVDDYKASHNAMVCVTEFSPIRWTPGADAYMNDLMDLFEQRNMNHALWEWHPAYPGQNENDAFAFMHGPDPTNHINVPSALRTVIENYWSRNTRFPSTEPKR